MLYNVALSALRNKHQVDHLISLNLDKKDPLVFWVQQNVCQRFMITQKWTQYQRNKNKN